MVRCRGQWQTRCAVLQRQVQESLIMPRDVKETIKHETGVIRLVQDRHDDPERTDRWFVECNAQFRFKTDAEGARKFFELLDAFAKD